MRTLISLASILVPLLLTGCGNFNLFGEEQNPPEVDVRTEFRPDAVADAEGNIYNISCVQKNAERIASEGRGAAARCLYGNAKLKTDAKGRAFSYLPGWWNSSWYLYPGYYSYYGFCSYFNSYYSGLGCSWISDFFGFGSSYFAWGGQCDHCLYRANPERCYSRCAHRGGWYF